MPPLPLTVTAPAPAAEADQFVDQLTTRRAMAVTSMRRPVDDVDAPHGELHVEAMPVARSWSAPAGHEASELPDVPVRVVPLAPDDHGRLFQPPPAAPAPAAPSGPSFTLIDAAIDDAARRAGVTSPLPGAPPTPATPLPHVAAPPAAGARQGLAASRRLGLGPAYHGPLPDMLRDLDPAGQPTEPAPDDLRQAVERATGVDVGPQMVHRGQVVSERARDIGATAFVQDERIYVSDDVGPLDTPTGRSVVAHELTHLAQIRRHGPVDESSPEGLAFEAQAQQVEQQVRGDADAADLVVVRETMRELVERGVARPDGDGGISFVMPASTMTSQTGVQRRAGDAPPAHSPGSSSTAQPQGFSSMSDVLRAAGGDLLSGAGSMLGLSDDVISGARHDMNRDIEHGDLERRFREVRLEHRRTERLDELNLLSHEHMTELSDDEIDHIRATIDTEVETRMQELQRASDAALARVNADAEHRLRELPDTAYDNAFRRLFDPDATRDLSEDDLVTLLTTDAAAALRTAATDHAARTGGSTPSPHPGSSGPTTQPGSSSTHPGGDHPAAHTGGTGTGTGTGSGDHAGGGGASGLAAMLGGGMVEMFGSVYGLSDDVQADMRRDLGLPATGAARGTHPGGTTGHDTAHPDAAHHDAAHAGADHAAAGDHPAAHPGAPGASGDHRTSPTGHPVLDIGHLDITELAERLYPSIRSRLRNELLIDRERAGRLADFR